MKKIINIIFLSIILVLSNSCSKSNKTNVIDLALQKTINLDNIYSHPVLLAIHNKIFVANSYDCSDGKIYVYDYEGKLITEFGNKGKGPAEFQSIIHMAFNNKKEILGIYDVYSWRISYFDINYDLIYNQTVSNVYFDLSYINGNLISLTRQLIMEDKKMFYDLVELEKPDSSSSIIEQKKLESSDIEYSMNNCLSFSTNKEYIFILDRNYNSFIIKQFLSDGTLRKEWKNIKNSNVKNINKLFIGEDFIIISFTDLDDVIFYQIYNFDEELLSTIYLDKENEIVEDVFKDKIFTTYEDESGNYFCNIYKIGK